MELFDRETALAVLGEALSAARAGTGQVVLVRGEAGIGKTELINHLLEGIPRDTPRFRGGCDDLITPRPLAPFHDIGRQFGGEFGALVRDGAPRDRIHDALLDHFAKLPPPVVMVLEDLHWADEATLDLVQSLGRRIGGRGVLLILTLRTGEASTDGGLLRVLAGVASEAVHHIDLEPLSVGAVEQLSSGTQIDPRELHRITLGNPFYVTEVVASGRLGPSPSVAATVAARMARLPARTRELLELVSVVPARTETSVLDRLEPDWPTVLEAAERLGIVMVDADAVSFRHELARVAVEQTLPVLTARRLHARVLGVLKEMGPEPSRLVHHAAGAGDVEAIVLHAPTAARRARAAESHREAVAQYERALRYEDRFPAADRARLYVELARSAMASDTPRAALESARSAVGAAREAGDDLLTGEALSRLSRIESWASNVQPAASAAEEAVALLAPSGPSSSLALAYAARCWVALTSWDGAAARLWAHRCIETANTVGDEALRVLGQTYEATLDLSESGEDGPLREAIAAAQALRERETATQGHAGAVTSLYFRREYARADRWIDEALAHCEQHEYLGWAPYFHAVRAAVRLETGAWREVEAEIDAAMARHQQPVWAVCVAITTRGRLWARTGRDGAREELERAWELASELGVPPMRHPVAVALTELQWLSNPLEDLPPELAEVQAEAEQLGWPGMLGEFGMWAARFGAQHADPGRMSRPFRLAVQGRHTEAAQAWQQLGCPYEQAEALTLSDDTDNVLQGLAILDDLGAKPLARLARARLRRLGVTGVPRGPRDETRENPAALTARQMEVLALMAGDLTNPQIADRLVVSKRTVDHHVSAILMKLGVSTRQDAIRVATEIGALTPRTAPAR
jgi:DNA-binding CsgD family transcriptional regulator